MYLTYCDVREMRIALGSGRCRWIHRQTAVHRGQLNATENNARGFHGRIPIGIELIDDIHSTSEPAKTTGMQLYYIMICLLY